jgi:hypothetical protein
MPAIIEKKPKLIIRTTPHPIRRANDIHTGFSDDTVGNARLPEVLSPEPTETSAFAPEKSNNTRQERPGENNPFEVSPLIRLQDKSPDRVFEMHQHYEGIVVEKQVGNNFTAELSDLTNEENPKEVADISFEEISEDDHHLIRPGAVFYWSIGIERSKGGQVRRVSEIRLRRLPLRTTSVFERAIEEGSKMFEQVRNASKSSSDVQ